MINSRDVDLVIIVVGSLASSFAAVGEVSSSFDNERALFSTKTQHTRVEILDSQFFLVLAAQEQQGTPSPPRF
jgi:hypothetical protein